MASDAHAHPAALIERHPEAEAERRALAVSCAASAWNAAEFAAHEKLAQDAARDGAAPIVQCFAAHPQLPAARDKGGTPRVNTGELLQTLETLAAEKRIDAVGETGFDLYNAAYRATEEEQEELFRRHLDIAIAAQLPVALHVRRAMHKIFAHTKPLRALPAVIFHAYSGTLAEAEALLKRGVNAYFSFGAAILLNHKTAAAACARVPLERLLTETDAPWQPLRGKPFSTWADLPAIIAAAAALRDEAAITSASFEAIVDQNFRHAYAAPNPS